MGRAIDARPWRPQDLIDDLQALIDEEQDKYLNDRHTTLCMARDYLKAYFSLPQPSNEALTLEELREMDEPVWCSCKPIEGGNGYWCLCRYGKIVTPSGNIFDVDKIPHWMFYRRPPEGEEDNNE
jgi:hypothetical protein